MHARWRIELLGGLRVCAADAHPGQPITRFGTRKTAALLAYLALHPGRDHPREELIELLWPETDPVLGSKSLRVAFSSLRRQLEPPGVPAGAVLVTDRRSARLNPESVTTDVAEFEEMLRVAATATTSLERVEALRKAVALYRGDLLPGHYEEWIPPEQRRLAQQVAQALDRLVRVLPELGEPRAALEHARHAVELDPLREAAQHALIRLLLAAGQSAAALGQYRQYEQRLARELGGVPGPSLRALAQQLELRARGGGGSPESARGLPGAERSGPAPRASLPRAAFGGDSQRAATLTLLLADCPGADVAVADSALDPLRAAGRAEAGSELGTATDSAALAFGTARQALAAATAARSPQFERLRIALHTGNTFTPDRQRQGPLLEETRQLLVAGHPGQILCSEPTAALLRHDPQAAWHPVDLGLYHLWGAPGADAERDAAGCPPRRLFQLVGAGEAPAQFPPLHAAPAFAARLPLQTTRFFGRASELERLAELLAPQGSGFGAGALQGSGSGRTDQTDRTDWSDPSDPNRCPEGHPPRTPNPELARAARLVTLTGPGGSGKSRLAVEAAAGLVEPYREGVWFVPLADLEEGRHILPAVADALRVQPSPHISVADQIADALGSAPCLLILDNFEQLVRRGEWREREEQGPDSQQPGQQRAGSDGPGVVWDLMARSPGLSCLITSRHLLGLEGEREFPVAPLPTPDAAAMVELVAKADSVRLFVDRATAHRPDFQVTRQNAAALAELCGRLEGVPLALELAAARIRLLTPAQMIAHLDQRLDFLVSRRTDIAPRHRTLRAAIEWSYRLLSPDLQRFFARLAVFRGGWTVEAAAAVCMDVWRSGSVDEEKRADTSTPPHVHDPLARVPPILPLDAVEELRDGSLVLVEESDETGPRFRMLETIREFAAEQMAPDERTAVERRHGEYFVQLAEGAMDEQKGPRQRERFRTLDAEHDNLRAALARAVARQPGVALRLSVALGFFWHVRGHLSEGRRWVKQALGADSAIPSLARARAIYQAALFAHDLGDELEAIALCEESLTLFRRLGDDRGIAATLTERGNLATNRGEPGAERILLEGLAAWRAVGLPSGTALCLLRLAGISLYEGDLPRARQFLAESLTLYRELGDNLNVAVVLSTQGDTEYNAGAYWAAEALYAESLALHRHVDSRRDIPIQLVSLALVALRSRDLGRTRRLLDEGFAGLLAIGDRRGVVATIASLGDVFLDTGDPERAVQLFAAAAAIYDAKDGPLTRSMTGRPPHLNAARATLGEERFAAAWQAGQALSLEEAVRLALDEGAS